MENKKIAKIFSEIAGLLEIKGDSAFRINANRRVARILESLQTDISELYKEKGTKGIRTIKGIGESSAKKIEEYVPKNIPAINIRAKYEVVAGPKKNKARRTRITVKEVLMDRTYDCSRLLPTISAKLI